MIVYAAMLILAAVVALMLIGAVGGILFVLVWLPLKWLLTGLNSGDWSGRTL